MSLARARGTGRMVSARRSGVEIVRAGRSYRRRPCPPGLRARRPGQTAPAGRRRSIRTCTYAAVYGPASTRATALTLVILRLGRGGARGRRRWPRPRGTDGACERRNRGRTGARLPAGERRRHDRRRHDRDRRNAVGLRPHHVELGLVQPARRRARSGSLSNLRPPAISTRPSTCTGTCAPSSPVACERNRRRRQGVADVQREKNTDYAIRVAALEGSQLAGFTLNVFLPTPATTPPGRRLPAAGASGHVDRIQDVNAAYSFELRAGVSYLINLTTETRRRMRERRAVRAGHEIL